jgi:membrane fusion protein, multidrug efflux system
MRAIYSYGVALIIVLGLAVWLGTGTLIQGGKGPGEGERPLVSLVDGGDGPLTSAIEGSGINGGHEEEGGIDPHLTIAERATEAGGGTDAAPRSVRIETITAQALPIEVPLRGRTKAKSSVSVVAQTSGIVTAVNFQKGATVKAGDLICTLDQGARKAAVGQAQAALDQAQAAYDTNKALRDKGLAAENTGLAVEAQLRGAQVALENATLELGRTEIKTEVGGVVQDPVANVGAMLSPGQPCATIVELNPMLFASNVPEARMAYAKLGLPAKVTTVSGQTVEGKVTYIAATADEATRSFPVEIELPNGDGTILDGITADAIVNVGTSTVHVLPQSVLTLDDSGVLGVRTVDSGNKVAFHAVTIIKDTRDGVWVVGLPFKINVITVGQEYVQPGQIVDAKTAEGELPS